MKKRIFILSAIVVLLLISTIIFMFLNFRFSPLSAAKNNQLLNKKDTLVKELSVNSHNIYLFRSNDGEYKTVLTQKIGPLWKSQIQFQYTNDKNMGIETVGYTRIDNNFLLLAFKSNDKNISYIKVETKDGTFKRPIGKEKIEVFHWNENVNLKELNITAYSKEGKELYYFGLPTKEKDVDDLRNLKWHAYNQ